MRPIDINISGQTWEYQPTTHKTEHRNGERRIWIGPRGQAAVRPFLTNRPVDAFLFSPEEAERERRAVMHAARTTPLSYGNVPGSNRRRNPSRSPGDHYTSASYRRAVEAGCKAAGVPVWTPHQLRHNTASKLRREFGIDVCQTILGHRLGSSITEIYCETNASKAVDAIAKIG